MHRYDKWSRPADVERKHEESNADANANAVAASIAIHSRHNTTPQKSWTQKQFWYGARDDFPAAISTCLDSGIEQCSYGCRGFYQCYCEFNYRYYFQ
mmetsp:Transcript_21204/g.46235  ORF Transcript_21204/g.46235 Transcript_21204/m.46235 type:complete len:97 (-) Transcript_21204:29-319(-)